MIDYLHQFNISSEELNEIKEFLNSDMIINLEVMQNNVKEVLTYLQNFGIKHLYNIIKYRPDILLKDRKDLEQELLTVDKNLLLFIFENDIDDLINLNI